MITDKRTDGAGRASVPMEVTVYELRQNLQERMDSAFVLTEGVVSQAGWRSPCSPHNRQKEEAPSGALRSRRHRWG